MKSHPSGRDSSVKGSSSAQHQPSGRHEPARPREHKYDLRVSYYSRMNPRLVFPLVVEVPRGKGAVPADGPTGVTVTLRPAVPGALVVPAQLPLEVSRPGARATFHVTPLVRGRLPEAGVTVLQDGRPVQELRTRMKVKTQRLARLLVLLAVALPAAVWYWTYVAPLQGMVSDTRTVPDLGQKKDNQAEKELARSRARPEAQPPLGQPGDRRDGPPAGMPGGPPPGFGGRGGGPGVAPILQVDEGSAGDRTETYMRVGTPGEVLDYRLRNSLTNNLPEFPSVGGAPASKDLYAKVAAEAGSAYGWLHGVSQDLQPAFWLAVLLLMLSFAAWVTHRPVRARRRETLVLAAAAAGSHTAETAETLPLAPHGERE